MPELSEQENKVLKFIQNYKRTHQGTSPSFDEIAMGCGFSNRSNARYHVTNLVVKKQIEYLGTRNILILVPEEEEEVRNA